MRWFYWSLALIFAAFWVDLGVTLVAEGVKRRRRERELARFNMAAFRGVKKSAWHL